MNAQIIFQYFFDAYPPAIKSGTFYGLIVLSVLFIVIGTLLKDYLIKKPEFRKRIDRYQKVLIIKISDIVITLGIINIFFVFFRKLRVPYFQMRFILFLWFIFVAVWIINALQHYIVDVPKLREQDEKRKKYEQYIS